MLGQYFLLSLDGIHQAAQAGFGDRSRVHLSFFVEMSQSKDSATCHASATLNAELFHEPGGKTMNSQDVPSRVFSHILTYIA